MANDSTRYSFTQPGLWPSPLQEQLLRAALLDGEAARQAWQQWRTAIVVDEELDRGSFRLLPLLYHNMHRLGVRDPFMQRLKGVYRRAWVENHRLFHQMRPLLQSFNELGIRTLLLKGAPLACAYYNSPATRPMADIDVLVRPSDARAVISFLESSEWKRHRSAADEDLHYRHSMQYSNVDGQEFDLHWHVLFEYRHAAADASFWASCVPFKFEGVSTYRLDTTHSFLHTVIHGIRWNSVPPIRWIADAMTLLKADGHAIDWDHIVRFAQENKVAYRLTLGLGYLQKRLDAPIPATVMRRLLKTRTTWLERIENTSVLNDTSRFYRIPTLGELWVIVTEYCRFADHQRPLAQWNGFPHYLRYRWRLNGRREIPTVIVKSFGRRLKRLLTCDTTNAIAAKSSTAYISRHPR